MWAEFRATVRERLDEWLIAPRYDDPWFTLAKLGVVSTPMEPHDFKPLTPVLIDPNGRHNQTCICGHRLTAMSQNALNWAIYEHIKFSSSVYAERSALAEAARNEQ